MELLAILAGMSVLNVWRWSPTKVIFVACGLVPFFCATLC